MRLALAWFYIFSTMTAPIKPAWANNIVDSLLYVSAGYCIVSFVIDESRTQVKEKHGNNNSEA